MAERTRKARMLDAPDYGTLDIELRWIGNKDMIASARPLEEVAEEQKFHAFLERFAQHCIKSWSAGEYSVTSGLAFLLKLEEGDGNALNALINRTVSPADFGIPRLVDPDDLGNS